MQVVRGLKILAFIASVAAGIFVTGCGSTGSAPTTDTPPGTPQLTISNVGAASILSSGAGISWTTNVAGTSQVDYGTTTSYGTSTVLDSNFVTSHSVTLANLQPAMQYNFRVRSKDSTGTEVPSANFTFTTLPSSAPVGPVISSVGATASVTGATITWSTDVPADDQVSYGTTSTYGQNSLIGTSLSTAHSVILSGLLASTTYNYQVKSKNASGTLSSSGNFTFVTSSVPPSGPVIGSVGATTTANGATVTWLTDVPADDLVSYGATTAYGQTSALGTTLKTSHSVVLSGLQSASTYDYKVTSKNAAGIASSSGNFTFATAVAPPVISNVVAVPTTTGATITWTTDKQADQQVDYGTTTSYGQSSALGGTLATTHSITLSGLNSGTTYDYRVKSRDAGGNLTVSANFSFVTAPATGSQVLSYINALANSTSAMVSWRSSVASDTQVDFGTTSSYGQSTTLDATQVLLHSAVLSGFTASTTYNFRVKSRDGAGNLTTSGNYTFTTNAAGASTIVPGIGWNQLANTQLQSVCPPNTSQYAFFDNCSNVVSAWSGGLPDLARNRLIVWGGGHVNYYGNELYAMNASDQTLTRITSPGPVASTAGGEVLADGTPNSRHTYDGMAYIAHADRMWAFSGSLASDSGNAGQDTWTFNFATQKWQLMDPVNGTGPVSAYGAVADYDPSTKNIFLLDIHSFLSYNFDTNTYTPLNGNDGNTYLIDYHDTAVIDPHRRLFIIFGGAVDFKVINIAPGSNYALQDWASQSTGCSPLINASAPGLAYDPVQDRIIGWAGGNTVYTLNPDTKTCTATTFANGPGADQGNGTFGRFRYMPGINAFLLVNGASENAYMLKLTTP